MENKTWAIRFVDKNGHALATELDSAVEPTMERASSAVVAWHSSTHEQTPLSDMFRNATDKNEQAMRFLGYEIVDIKIIVDPLLSTPVVVDGTAPWYLWKSKLNGNTTCQQTSPGEGWEQDGGPYQDSKCNQ